MCKEIDFDVTQSEPEIKHLPPSQPQIEIPKETFRPPPASVFIDHSQPESFGGHSINDRVLSDISSSSE